MKPGKKKSQTWLRLGVAVLTSVSVSASWAADAALAPLRPPAVPLITHDPYFSTWSMGDRLADSWPKHWTEKTTGLSGIVRIDGRPLRFLGNYAGAPETLEQTAVTVTATRSIYQFEGRGVALTVTFMSPLLMDDFDLMSRPATYVTFDAVSTDGRPHDVQVLFEACGELCTNAGNEPVVTGRREVEGMNVLSIGMAEQKTLKRSGDDLRIEWGYLLVAAQAQGNDAAIGLAEDVRQTFVKSGHVPGADLPGKARRADDGFPVLAVKLDLGSVEATPVSKHLIVAYDDVEALQYFGKNLRAWWRRDPEMTAEKMLAAAERDYARVVEQCVKLDEQIMAQARAAGGEKYARLCALAYRQTIAAHKLAADVDGKTPIFISKENSSNGCAATVDVTYPSAPFFLLYAPALLKAQLVPVMRYAETPAWKFDFGPHDVGQYPLVNGNVYGNVGGENKLEFQMPIEESGNLLILLAALARAEGNAEFSEQHWATVTKWADYLVANGLDPVNQLCTADMFGHLAHNADLSLKAIIGIGGYAQLCETLGKKDEAKKYRAVAQDYAAMWQKMVGKQGPTRLAFDRPGTWGMKHNLIWDRVLGLGLFPDSVGDREITHYLKMQNAFGLPCDNRTPTTLVDWEIWCASVARDRADFEALVAPLYRASNETANRVPMTDWFDTTNAVNSGFRARSVVGGIYMKILVDQVQARAKKS